MIMCVLLCYPVSIRTYYQQGVLFLVKILIHIFQQQPGKCQFMIPVTPSTKRMNTVFWVTEINSSSELTYQYQHYSGKTFGILTTAKSLQCDLNC